MHRISRVRRCLLLLGALWSTGMAHARDVGPAWLPERIEVLAETGTPLGLKDVCCDKHAGGFEILDGHVLSQEILSPPSWVRVTLPPLGNEEFVLSVGSAMPDEVDFYVPQPGSINPLHESAGYELPFSSRSIKTAVIAFPLPEHLAREGGELYLRIVNPSKLDIPFEVWSRNDFLLSETRRDAPMFMFYGVILAMLIYNLFVYFSIRDVGFLYYIAFISALTLDQMNISGMGARLFWPEMSGYSNLMLLTVITVAICAGNRFFQHYLQTQDTAPWAHRILNTTTVLAPASLVSSALIHPAIILALLVAMATVNLTTVLVATIRSFRRGVIMAKYLLFSFIGLGPGLVLAILFYYSLVPGGALLNYVMEISIGLDALLFSIALSLRVKMLYAEKTAAEQQLFKVQRGFSQRLIEMQDAERKRIASALHDSIGQSLLVIQNRLKRLLSGREDNADNLQDKLTSIRQDSSEAIEEVRRVAHGLHPHQLEHLGLKAAVERICEQACGAAGIGYQCDVEADKTQIEPQRAIHIYRIIQEALNNIVKHARARNCRIGLEIGSDQAQLEIRDDGKGIMDFNLRSALPESFGLQSINERVNLLGGRWDMRSEQGEGTLITISFPA